MCIRVGGRYRYRIGDFIIDTYFFIESYDGTRYTGRTQDWCESIWYFSSDGRQVGTQLSPDSGAPSVSLVLEDD